MAVFGNISKLTPATDADSNGPDPPEPTPSEDDKLESKSEGSSANDTIQVSGLGMEPLSLLGGKKDSAYFSVANSPTRKRDFESGEFLS